MNPELIVYAVIFVAVLVLVEGIYLTAFGKSISLDSKLNRRMEMLEKGGSREEVLDQLRKEMTQHIAAQRIPVYALLAAKAQKANIAFTPPQLMMVMAGLSAFAFLGLTVGTSSGTAMNLLIAPIAGIGGVYMWVSGKAKKRMALIEEQLPDAIELMVRSLRVGHPFSSAVQIVAKEVADPLASEFGVIADESAYGRDVSESLRDLAERMDMQDLRFLAVAVTIQQQAGGNLAEVLDGLSKVIRSRFKLFRRVNAITAEAKWSGKFLSGFPVLAIVGVNMLDPNYFDSLKESSFFVIVCLVVAGFLAANVFVMKRLTDIKV